MEGIAAARAFVAKYYPDCLAALLFGSVARGEARPNSDLDILIVTSDELQFYRKSFRDFGWFIEAYVGSQKLNEEKIALPRANRNPSFLNSWAECLILNDHDDFAQFLKQKAIEILGQGPHQLTQTEIDQYRYVITDWIDDLLDSSSYEEALFIVYELTAKAGELLLAHNRQWIGDRRWLYRALERSGDPLARQLIEAMAHFYRTGEKARLIKVVEVILEIFGGKLYEGFSRVG